MHREYFTAWNTREFQKNICFIDYSKAFDCVDHNKLCDSWTIKKSEQWKTDAFELWCWRRLLRVPWIARRSNQSILKEINNEYSLEGLKLKLQYFGHLMWRVTIGKDPDAGKDWRQEEKRMTEDEMLGWNHWLDGQKFKQALGDGEGQGDLACFSQWGHKELDMTEWLNNNTPWKSYSTL